MGVTLNTGSGGSVAETVELSGTDERDELEAGYAPTYCALTAALSLVTANLFHFVLFNNNATALVCVHKVVWIPASSVSSIPSSSGILTARLRISPTSAPTGGSGASIQSFDSGDTLPSSISAFSGLTSTPAGGTTLDLLPYFGNPDRIELGTLTATTLASTCEFSGRTIFETNQLGMHTKPLLLRQNQCFEVQQAAAANASTTFQTLCIFSVI